MIQIKNKGIFKGRYRFKTFKAERGLLKLLMRFFPSVYLFYRNHFPRLLLRQTDWIRNLIVLNDDNGLNLVLQALNGQITYDLEITTAKIGTGDTPPADGDTDLEIPTVTIGDIVVATRTLITDTLTLEFFISDAQIPEDEYKEFGLFCGTQLFARSLITPTYTKAIGEDTICEYVIEVSNV